MFADASPERIAAFAAQYTGRVALRCQHITAALTLFAGGATIPFVGAAWSPASRLHTHGTPQPLMHPPARPPAACALGRTRAHTLP